MNRTGLYLTALVCGFIGSAHAMEKSNQEEMIVEKVGHDLKDFEAERKKKELAEYERVVADLRNTNTNNLTAAVNAHCLREELRSSGNTKLVRSLNIAIEWRKRREALQGQPAPAARRKLNLKNE